MSHPIAFLPADILIPKNCDLTKWTVVACDQYTSQPEYWARVDQFVGDAPSSLRLILPESKLEGDSVAEDIQNVNQTMGNYLDCDQFSTYPNAMIYVERTQQNGNIRRGIVGMVDLEEYDYTPGSAAQVRATEGTVLSRIPPRVKVRENAPIELPHVMLLTDDPQKTVIEPLMARKSELTQIYDFDLMENSGHIAGWLLDDAAIQAVDAALLALKAQDAEKFKNLGKPELAGFLFAAGDGNHSLATAKTCYENQKKLLPESQWADLPARFALCELVNLHDEALEFEPIHRIVTGVNVNHLLNTLVARHPGSCEGEWTGHILPYMTSKVESAITIANPTAQLEVGTLQNFLDSYLEEFGGSIDYIHGADVTRQLAQQEGAIGFLLPPMAKSSLFPTVIYDGVLPRKTFSMGEAHDKRFYLETRKI